MTNPDLAALSAAAIAARAQYESGQADLKAMLSASQDYLAALETEFLLGNLVQIDRAEAAEAENAKLREALEECVDQLWHLAKDPDTNPWIKQARTALAKHERNGHDG